MSDSVARYEKFCQLKKSLPSEGPHLIVGIDVGKYRHTACVRRKGQILMRQFGFDNSKAGYARLQEKVAELQRKAGVERIVYGVESTGNYHKPLAYFLQQNGEAVVMVSTLAVRRNRETLDVSWDKSDPKDAENIADLVAQGNFYFGELSDDIYGEIRHRVRHYLKMQEEKKKIKIKLRNDILSSTFPELDRLFPDVGARLLQKILRQTPFPWQIRRLSEAAFAQSLGGGFGRGQSKIKQVYQAAGQSVGIELQKDAIGMELDYLLTRYAAVRETIAQVYEKITTRLASVTGYRHLQTIPGVGPWLAAVIWSEVGDPGRYTNARQLIKLAGLDIARYQSGEFCSQGRISKRGRKLLRHAVYHAAVAATQEHSPFRRRYRSLLQRQGDRPIPLKAIIAIACKILRIVFRVLKSGKPYDPQYDEQLRCKYKQAPAPPASV